MAKRSERQRGANGIEERKTGAMYRDHQNRHAATEGYDTTQAPQRYRGQWPQHAPPPGSVIGRPLIKVAQAKPEPLGVSHDDRVQRGQESVLRGHGLGPFARKVNERGNVERALEQVAWQGDGVDSLRIELDAMIDGLDAPSLVRRAVDAARQAHARVHLKEAAPLALAGARGGDGGLEDMTRERHRTHLSGERQLFLEVEVGELAQATEATRVE